MGLIWAIHYGWKCYKEIRGMPKLFEQIIPLGKKQYNTRNLLVIFLLRLLYYRPRGPNYMKLLWNDFIFRLKFLFYGFYLCNVPKICSLFIDIVSLYKLDEDQ